MTLFLTALYLHDCVLFGQETVNEISLEDGHTNCSEIRNHEAVDLILELAFIPHIGLGFIVLPLHLYQRKPFWTTLAIFTQAL